MEKEVAAPLCVDWKKQRCSVLLTLPCESVLLEGKKGIWLGSLSVCLAVCQSAMHGCRVPGVNSTMAFYIGPQGRSRHTIDLCKSKRGSKDNTTRVPTQGRQREDTTPCACLLLLIPSFSLFYSFALSPLTYIHTALNLFISLLCFYH